MWALKDYHIVHSDIKPDNFLIVNGGSVVLSDFGLAQTPEPALPTTADFLEWRGVPGGTPGYYAPQVLLSVGRYVAHKCDIFSLGLVFVEVLAHMRGAVLWDVFKVPVEHADTPEVWSEMPPGVRQKWLMDNYWLEWINLSVMSPERDLIETVRPHRYPVLSWLLMDSVVVCADALPECIRRRAPSAPLLRRPVRRRRQGQVPP